MRVTCSMLETGTMSRPNFEVSVVNCRIPSFKAAFLELQRGLQEVDYRLLPHSPLIFQQIVTYLRRLRFDLKQIISQYLSKHTKQN